jgi:xylulokinase
MIYLVVDIGTSGSKAALINDAGEILKSGQYSYPTHTDAGGIVEQVADDWYQEFKELIRELNSQGIDAIILTGQMQNLILLDGQGKVLRKVILYSDTRATREAEQVKTLLGREHLRHVTGNNQEASGLLAKLCWLKTQEPMALEKAKHIFFGAADYIAFKLTGQTYTDTTTASTTGLMNLVERKWLSEELKTLNLPVQRLLPKLVLGGAQVGQVQKDIGELLGIQVGIPVFLAPGDAGTATLGIGSGEKGKPYAYMGTSGWVGFTSENVGNSEMGVFTLAHPEPLHYICVAPLLTAGGNLDWVCQRFGFLNHEQMIESALKQPQNNLLYLPYLNGERSPFYDANARGAFIGISSHHTKADLARAVLEGVAFAYKHTLDAIMTEPFSKLALTGGGARSAAFAQLLADIIGVDIVIPSEAEFTGLLGALLAVQVKTRQRTDYYVEQQGLTLKPNQEYNYQKKYRHFRKAYPSLRHLFQEMAE